jgi:hypothetical protein
MSSSFGRAADFVEENIPITPDTGKCAHQGMETWLALSTGHVEPYFTTQYWCQRISHDLIDVWAKAASPKAPTSASKIHLPIANPYIPNDFDLKPLPLDDSHHPLLYCSIKLCVPVGKSKVCVIIYYLMLA